VGKTLRMLLLWVCCMSKALATIDEKLVELGERELQLGVQVDHHARVTPQSGLCGGQGGVGGTPPGCTKGLVTSACAEICTWY